MNRVGSGRGRAGQGPDLCLGPFQAAGMDHGPPNLLHAQVLRQHFNSSLPVEVAWQGAHELDPASWKEIERRYAPITG